jgi:hypothetical protein
MLTNMIDEMKNVSQADEIDEQNDFGSNKRDKNTGDRSCTPTYSWLLGE